MTDIEEIVARVKDGGALVWGEPLALVTEIENLREQNERLREAGEGLAEGVEEFSPSMPLAMRRSFERRLAAWRTASGAGAPRCHPEQRGEQSAPDTIAGVPVSDLHKPVER